MKSGPCHIEINFKYPGKVTHAYTPSYLGGGEQKNCGLRRGWAKSSQDPISTNSFACWCALVIPRMQDTNGKKLKGRHCS
jgi:hypothetical protein